MKTKHNYFELENSLTYGRYFVYRGGPGKAPGGGESKETGGEKPDDKEKPATLKDVKDKLQGIKNMLRRTVKQHKETAENNPKVKQLKQKIAEIEKKIKSIEEEKGEKRQKVINEVNGELDSILKLEPKYSTPKGVTEKGEKPGGRAVALKFYKEGSKQFNKRNYPEAIKSFKKAEFHYPKAIGLQHDLAVSYKSLGDNKNALKHYKVFIKRAKESKKDKYKKVITEAEDFVKKTEAKVAVKPKPKGKDKAPKPKGSPEGKEKVSTNPKEKLSHLLGKVLEGGKDSFKKNKGEITNLLKSLNIKPGRQNQAAGYDLPGGFTVGHVNWSKGEGMPNFAIFKGGETLCYMQDTGKGKMELSFARELGQNERPGYNRRMVELMKANVLLPKALSQIKTHPKTKRLTFANPSALNDFKSALLTMAKMSKLDKKAGPDWEAVYGGKNIQFERSGESLNGAFKIRVGNNIMHFDTASPNQIGVEEPGWKGNGEKGISYRNDGDFLFTPKEQKQNDKSELTLKTKKEPTKVKKPVDKKALERDIERDIKKLPDKFLKAKVGKLVNSKFKKLVSQSKSNPKVLTVKAEKNNKKGLSLIKNNPIHKLLNLKTIKNEVVMVTIKGAPGKSERKAMYYPGQKTAYVVKNGKQTKNRVKFHNGDTISLEFKNPEAKDYANLNRDKNKAQVFSAERIGRRALFNQYNESVTKFGKLKGKLSDLNLKSLAKYKNASYDPKQILTGKNLTKAKVKKLGYKKANEILEAEIKIIEEGGSKLAKKKGVKDPFDDGLY